MSPGNVEFVQVVVGMLTVPAAIAAIVLRDERRLSPDRLARAWPPSTRNTVFFASWQVGVLFGAPALVVWFTRTRRSLWGAVLGLFWATVLFAVAVVSAWLPEVAIEALRL